MFTTLQPSGIQSEAGGVKAPLSYIHYFYSVRYVALAAYIKTLKLSQILTQVTQRKCPRI